MINIDMWQKYMLPRKRLRRKFSEGDPLWSRWEESGWCVFTFQWETKSFSTSYINAIATNSKNPQLIFLLCKIHWMIWAQNKNLNYPTFLPPPGATRAESSKGLLCCIAMEDVGMEQLHTATVSLSFFLFLLPWWRIDTSLWIMQTIWSLWQITLLYLAPLFILVRTIVSMDQIILPPRRT